MSDYRPNTNRRQTSPVEEDSMGPLEVQVRDNNIGKAMRSLQKLIGQEGFLFEMKKRQYYQKPSVAKREKSIRAQRRARKTEREDQKDY